MDESYAYHDRDSGLLCSNRCIQELEAVSGTVGVF